MEKYRFKLLLFILVLALAVRISVFSTVFSNGNITFLGADTYYHIRRILFAASHFPGSLDFDSYIDFPNGAKVGWMPLYDQFIALVALVAGLGKPSLHTVEVAAAVIPPLLGALTVLLVFFIAEKLFDWRVGILSAGILAITPAHVYVSFLGYADHHVAEALLSTAAYLFFIASIERLKKENISSREGILKNSLFPALTGIVLALSIFTWNGAPIFVGIIGVFIIVQSSIDRFFGRSSDYLTVTGGIAFFVSLLIVTPVALIHGIGFEINSSLPTLFHTAFLIAFFLTCLLLAFMQRLHFKKWWYHPLLLVLMFSAALYTIQFSSPGFYSSAAGGITYLFGGGILSMVREAVPLFSNPGNGYTLAGVWNNFTLSFFIALLSFAVFARRVAREKYAPEPVFLVVWTLIVLALTVLQQRFVYLLAVNISIFSAYFVITVLESLQPAVKAQVTKKKSKARRTSSPAPGICLLIIVLLAIPNIITIESMATEDISAPASDLQESFEWLGDNSPATSHYDAPEKPAEYGVMSWWDNGNWILYFSHRPVVANNFQTGIEDTAHFLVEPDEKAANGILDKRKVRFVVTDAAMLKRKFAGIAMLAGRNPEDYYGTQDEDVQIRSVNNENENFFSTMLSRLHVFDGSGLSRYRLIYESRTTAIRSPDIKYVKIFEYVPGAVLSGSGDGDIKATLSVLTNQGRTFTYTAQTTAENGKYELKIPYPTQGSKYETKALGDYIIQSGNSSRAIQVSEEDVLEGREIKVDLI